jgi:hypothetical protein
LILVLLAAAEPPAGADRTPAYQVFSFPCDKLPKNIETTGFARFTALIFFSNNFIDRLGKSPEVFSCPDLHDFVVHLPYAG